MTYHNIWCSITIRHVKLCSSNFPHLMTLTFHDTLKILRCNAGKEIRKTPWTVHELPLSWYNWIWYGSGFAKSIIQAQIKCNNETNYFFKQMYVLVKGHSIILCIYRHCTYHISAWCNAHNSAKYLRSQNYFPATK